MISLYKFHVFKLTIWLYYVMQLLIWGHHEHDRVALTCLVRHRIVLDMDDVSTPQYTSGTIEVRGRSHANLVTIPESIRAWKWRSFPD